MISISFWCLAYCCPLPFIGPWNCFTLGKTQQFFCILGSAWIAFLIWLSVLAQAELQTQTQTKPLKQGTFTGAGNSSLPNFIHMALIYRDPIDQAQT
jgi:hypothetical protein